MNRSDVPPWFGEALAPLVRNCRGDAFTEEQAKDYWIILRTVPEQFLKAAVVDYLRNATEPWMPMPKVLWDLAKKARRTATIRAIAAAPDCRTCGNTGLVSARVKGQERWSAFACVSCARGLDFRQHQKHDAEAMETWTDHSRRIAGDAPAPPIDVKRLVAVIGKDIPGGEAVEQ